MSFRRVVSQTSRILQVDEITKVVFARSLRCQSSLILVAAVIVLTMFVPTTSTCAYICGDADSSGAVNIGDVTYLVQFILGSGPAPLPFAAGNADGCGGISIGDINRLVRYLFQGWPAPDGCSNSSLDCYVLKAGNIVSRGCQPFPEYPSGDSVQIHLRFSNSDTVQAMSFGLHYNSNSVEITSFSKSGSVIPDTSRLSVVVDSVQNVVRILWDGLSLVKLPPQTDGAFVTLNARILTGPTSQYIPLDTSAQSVGDLVALGTDSTLYYLSWGLFCDTIPDNLFSVEELHDSAASFLAFNQIVTLKGYYNAGDSNNTLYSNEAVYVSDQILPSKSEVYLGGQPLADDFEGSVWVTGYISNIQPSEIVFHPDDSLSITFSVISATYFGKSVSLVKEIDDDLFEFDDNVYKNYFEPDSAAGCRYAVLLAGGVDSANNKERYRVGLASAYNYLKAQAFPDSNIKIIYYQPDPKFALAGVPDSIVKSATIANFENACQRISNSIKGSCTNRKVRFFSLVFDHGQKVPNGIHLLDTLILTPGQFRSGIEKILEAGVDTSVILMNQCYAGGPALELKNAADTSRRATLYVTSTSTVQVPNLSLIKGSQVFEAYKGSRGAGNNDQKAIRAGLKDYASRLGNLKVLLAPEPDTGWILGMKQTVDSCIHYKSILWQRDQFRSLAESNTLAGFPGGKFVMTFPDAKGDCGNVVVYEHVTADGGKWIKRHVWNFNAPGSKLYVAANNPRRLVIPTGSTGDYKVVSAGKRFSVTTSCIADTNFNWKLNELSDPSNPEEFAGFLLGWDDDYGDEFGDFVQATVSLADPNSSGFDLSTVPQNWGTSGSVTLNVPVSVPTYNEWWTDVDIVIDVASVISPAVLQYSIPSATNPVGSVSIDTAGIYSLHVGSVANSPSQLLVLSITSGDFVLDALAMSTRVSTAAVNCGDADGNEIITISDAVFLINYIFAGGPAPNPVLDGDADCNSIVTISDAVYLINYIFAGGAAPCAACP